MTTSQVRDRKASRVALLVFISLNICAISCKYGRKTNYIRYNRITRINTHDKQNKLYEMLVGRKSNYNPLMRAESNLSGITLVTHEFMLREIVHADEETEKTSVRATVTMRWRDDYLRWNSKAYGNVKTIRISPQYIWKPDVFLLNGKTDADKNQNAILDQDGTVTWSYPALFTVSCRYEFRSNSWICPYAFQSWSYTNVQLNLRPPTNKEAFGVDVSSYVTNGNWALVGTQASQEPHQQPCCKQPFDRVTYVVRLRKKIGNIVSAGKRAAAIKEFD